MKELNKPNFQPAPKNYKIACMSNGDKATYAFLQNKQNKFLHQNHRPWFVTFPQLKFIQVATVLSGLCWDQLTVQCPFHIDQQDKVTMMLLSHETKSTSSKVTFPKGLASHNQHAGMTDFICKTHNRNYNSKISEVTYRTESNQIHPVAMHK